MPGRRAALLVLATLALVPSAAGLPAAGGPAVELYAQWPSDFATAVEEPIALTPLAPLGDPDLSSGPATPGSRTAGTQVTFTYRLVTPNGSAGPSGDVRLDPSRPVRVDLYLSADQTAWPAAAGPPPEDVDYGVAPQVTVEATLHVAGDVVATDARTQHLVTAPEPVGTPVHRYVLELPVDEPVLREGAGLTIELAVHQIDRHGEQAHQPLWNVHTGERFPSGVTIPTDPVQRPPTQDEGLSTASLGGAETREARTVAVGVLVAATAVAALAGARLIGQWRG